MKPDVKAAKLVNRAIKKCMLSPSRGLHFVPLQRVTLCVAVFVDAGFASIPDLK